jgi:signal transduction histidine kinase
MKDAGVLLQRLENEPPWSNFPLIVLTPEGHSRQSLPTHPKLNATLVERPVRVATLRSVVEAALRHRKQQYQNRDMLVGLAAQAEELRQAKVELEDANAALERRVHERTVQLRETVTELEAFSYTISHDLRAPLRAMQGYAEALITDKSDQLDDEGKHFLDRIQRAATRLDSLIQDVLAYSRIAKSDVQLTAICLDNFLKELLYGYPGITEKLKIALHSPMPPVLGHEGYLSQCVANLLGNAAKFTRPDVTPQVVIRAEQEAEWVRIWFEDNGIGIAPEHHHQIFQIFGRVYAEKQFEGTGIGLAIVRKAAERMGGKVGVLSELGKGSRFWLSLKKADEQPSYPAG